VSEGPAPDPGSPEERAADRRALKVMLIWFCVMVTLAALYLVLAIYVDWI
jgi:hypothetical protein